ncbi:hypothetical protein JOM56_013759 [Amanita muscaria]
MLFPVVEEEEEDWCQDVQLREDEEETLIGMSIGEDDAEGIRIVEAGEMAWDSREEDGRNPNTVGGRGIKVMIEPERPKETAVSEDLSIKKNISPEPTPHV